MDRNWHINKCLRQLNYTPFYRPLENDIAQRMLRDNIIDKNTKPFLIQPIAEPGRFYNLPKKTRKPWTSSSLQQWSPTERLSQFADYQLQPLVKTTNSFIKETTHFQTKMKQ